jgi:NAD(P)-dependent dehydrogenase (short-subunit alcohol dehydrogenase family)
MISLENQVAVVTGAGRGIGRAVAIELAQLGMRVALTSRTRADLEETARGVPGAHVAPADIRNRGEVEGMLSGVVDRFGPIDVLINSAGVYHFGPVVEATDDDFDSVVETNLKGIFFASRAVLPSMIKRRKGYIINIASIAGKVGSPGRALYCASKFGVVGFSQALAEEVRAHGIRVSVVCPGSTNTDFSPKETADKSRERMLQPADVAHAVRMLLGQESNSFISEIVMRPTQKP